MLYVWVLIIFIFIYKDIEWFNIIIRLGCDYYSIILVIKILDFWFNIYVFNESSEIKLLIFINILIVLIIFFIFIDLILFYLIFEISLILTFFLIIYWGRNSERLSGGTM